MKLQPTTVPPQYFSTYSISSSDESLNMMQAKAGFGDIKWRPVLTGSSYELHQSLGMNRGAVDRRSTISEIKYMMYCTRVK